MNSDNTIDLSDLNLGMGHVLTLMPHGDPSGEFSDVVLVGGVPGQTLIITAPESGLFPRLEEGQQVVVRVRMDDGLAVFSSTVLFIADVPMFAVYLDYPTGVKYKQIRNARRVKIALPILCSNLSDRSRSGIVGTMVDISTTGAGIEAEEDLGGVGDTAQIKGRFDVAGTQKILTLRAVIRKAKALGNGHYSYGVEFLEGSDEDLFLFGYVYNAMAHGKIQAIN